MPEVLAHETWFTKTRPALEWSLALEPASLALIGSALLALLVYGSSPWLAPVTRWLPGRSPVQLHKGHGRMWHETVT